MVCCVLRSIFDSMSSENEQLFTVRRCLLFNPFLNWKVISKGILVCVRVFFLLIIVYRIQKGWDTTANYALNRIASYVHHSFTHVYMKCIRLRYTALLLMVPLPLLPLLLLLLRTTAVLLDVMKVCSVRCRSCVSTSRTIFLLLCLYLRWRYIAPRR